MERDPLRLVKEGNVIKRGKGDMITKEDELRLIQSIEVLDHQPSKCTSKPTRARQGPLVVPILRIRISDHLLPYMWNRGCLARNVCPHLKGLGAKKLVIITDGADSSVHLDRANVGMVDEFVVDVSSRLMDCEYPDLHLRIEAKRLVVLFSPDNIPYWPTYTRTNDQVLMWSSAVSRQIAMYARLRHSACDIVMVNFRDLDSILKFIGATANQPPSFEALCKEDFDSFNYHEWDLPRYQHWRNASEVSTVKYKFISLKEYVTNYDWKGVFTEERAAQILQQADE